MNLAAIGAPTPQTFSYLFDKKDCDRSDYGDWHESEEIWHSAG